MFANPTYHPPEGGFPTPAQLNSHVQNGWDMATYDHGRPADSSPSLTTGEYAAVPVTSSQETDWVNYDTGTPRAQASTYYSAPINHNYYSAVGQAQETTDIYGMANYAEPAALPSRPRALTLSGAHPPGSHAVDTSDT